MSKLAKKIIGESFKILKKRNIKKSTRGFYIHDKELCDTYFKIGTHIKYIMDVTTKKLILVPTNKKTANIVSTKKYKEIEKPIIDLRRKDILSTFEGCEYLELTILEDTIAIEGYKNSSEAVLDKTGFINKIRKALGLSLSRKAVVNKKANKIKEIILSKKQLADAVGFENINVLDTEYSDFLQTGNDGILKNTAIRNKIKKNLENDKLALKAVSLFSASGMLDKGFKDNGFQFVRAIELDPNACKSYKYNIGDVVECSDITNIDLSELPKAPIIIAGIPCKKFSAANRVDNVCMLENPEHILVEKFIQTVEMNNECKIFIVEEVPEIFTACNGKFFDEIKKRLNSFDISHGVLNSAHFGTAQNRERGFIIGSKIGKIDLPVGNPNTVVTVRDAFKGLNISIPNQLDFSKPKAETIERMKHIPQDGNIFNIPKEIRPKGCHSNAYKRLAYDKISITIVNPRKSVITHPEENRILSVRECARIQGMPDDFIYKGNLSSMQQQVCDGVPYQLSTAIAKLVRNAIEKYNDTTKNTILNY